MDTRPEALTDYILRDIISAPQLKDALIMIEKMYSVKEVAAKTGKAIITVRKLVVAHGLGQKIGRDWVLTEDDIAIIANVKMGRPTEKLKDNLIRS